MKAQAADPSRAAGAGGVEWPKDWPSSKFPRDLIGQVQGPSFDFAASQEGLFYYSNFIFPHLVEAFSEIL